MNEAVRIHATSTALPKPELVRDPAESAPPQAHAGRPRRRPGRPRQEEPSLAYLARRDEIVEVAARVFHEKGYDTGSLDDVADVVGLHKSSLYHYVKSKAELLYLVFDRGMNWGLRRIEEIGMIEDPAERLASLVRFQVLTVSGEPGHFNLFFDHRPRFAGPYEQAIRAKQRAYLRAFAEAVATAAEAGAIPPVAPRYGAQAILGMVNWAYKWFDPGRDDPREIAETMVRLLLAPRPSALAIDGNGERQPRQR